MIENCDNAGKTALGVLQKKIAEIELFINLYSETSI